MIRTKRVPLVGRDVEAYAEAYRAYVAALAGGKDDGIAAVDPAPRVILDPELGLVIVGSDALDLRITGDLYRHTMEIVLRATALGGYTDLPSEDVFDVEDWHLEQAKL